MAKSLEKIIVGVDEAGRGPLAGPVVASAVKIKKMDSYLKENRLNIRDSKKITLKRREELYEILTNHPEIEWGVGVVSEKIIDQINILQATKLAMQEAVEKISIEGCVLIIDGNFGVNINHEQRSLPKADESVLECSMASVIAKVTRDRIMNNYHKKYAFYHFDKHKGYGTKLHREMILKHGPCDIHRQSFRLL
ncbi:MAG: ribonuclease HII [Candidatus Pacebacteria bacterium]|nr:ribonuclease HII [Candidatus Paceibacterota bacterium]